MRWERDTSELMQSVTAQHLPSTGFLPLDLSHLCLHSHISRICQGSHLPAIMWKKYRKLAACISSTLFLLQHSWALDKETNSMLKTTSLMSTPEKQLGSDQELQQTGSEICEPHSLRSSLGDEAQLHRSPETSAQQGDSEHCSEQGHHENSLRSVV